LQVGHEGEFTIKDGRMFLKVPDGDRKMRTYQIVAIEPINADAPVRSETAKLPDKQ
jgi:hypothetical protein